MDEDELTLAAAEGGADDVALDGSSYQVSSAPEDLSAVRQAIEAAGFTVESAELTMVPKPTVEVDEESTAKRSSTSSRASRRTRTPEGRHAR